MKHEECEPLKIPRALEEAGLEHGAALLADRQCPPSLLASPSAFPFGLALSQALVLFAEGYEELLFLCL